MGALSFAVNNFVFEPAISSLVGTLYGNGKLLSLNSKSFTLPPADRNLGWNHSPNPAYLIPLSNVVADSSDPIDKFSLLNLVKKVYKKDILIRKNTEYCIDRSLDSTKFRKATGYEPLSWNELVEIMYQSGNFS